MPGTQIYDFANSRSASEPLSQLLGKLDRLFEANVPRPGFRLRTGNAVENTKTLAAQTQRLGLPVPPWDQEEVDAVGKDLKCVPWKP